MKGKAMLPRLIATTVLLGAIIGGADARDPALECEKIKQKMRMVQAKMRAGYTRAEGEKLAAELRRLRALRTRACRR